MANIFKTFFFSFLLLLTVLPSCIQTPIKKLKKILKIQDKHNEELSDQSYKDNRDITGYGEISKTTGLPRTEIVRGHWRKTDKGYKYIKPYVRSKRSSYRKLKAPTKYGITGYGKISKITGRPRTKVVRGHWRKTSRGYKYINSYARS